MSEKRVKTSRKAEQNKIIAKYARYRNGGEGICAWAEENVRVPIYPIGSEFAVWVLIGDLPDDPHLETGRSYKSMWENQKAELVKALRMENGLFVHSLVIFCWMRGEGKSFIANLIDMWKFFCWPKQKIVLGSSSKDQSSFLQFKEIREIIENSPKLHKIVGGRNILEDSIRRRDAAGNVVSTIQTISSFSGIVSNITGCAFSEFWEFKQPQFFNKVFGSIRNTPNAIATVDSTVSSKQHQLYGFYKSFLKQKNPKIYFSYRCSKDGDYKDFWHPYQTQAQLDMYRDTFPLGDFARYFQNLWSAGAERVFSQEEVDAIQYLGADGSVNCQNRVIDLLRRRYEVLDGDRRAKDRGLEVFERSGAIAEIEKRLWPVSDAYRLQTETGVPVIAENVSLDRLSDIYDTDWAILCGLDRADPMKRRTSARTVFTAIAKGLPGSRSNPSIGRLDPQGESDSHHDKVLGEKMRRPELTMPKLGYIYFLLYVAVIHDHSTELLKSNILLVNEEFDGIDMVGSERYAAWDLPTWGEEYNIPFLLVHSTYPFQLAMFSYFFTVIRAGRFKAPPSGIPGSKGDDLVQEEMSYFDHDSDTKWFGSPEKTLKSGVQDDCMDAMGNGIYAGRFLGVDDFRPRRSQAFWGTMFQPGDLVGRW